jgi:hypothetical protein
MFPFSREAQPSAPPAKKTCCNRAPDVLLSPVK